ncbi:MAG: aminopeptidase [Bacillota bacterium]
MSLEKAAILTLKNCMGIKKGEQILVVTDTPLYSLGQEFFNAAKELECEALQMNFLPRDNNGEEPPQAVAAAMKDAQVVLLITSKSLSHTRARKEANLAGARIASMPGITEEMILRTLTIDYGVFQEQAAKLEQILSGGGHVHLTSEAGTDLTFSIEGRKGLIDAGIYTKPGDFGNLPAGEVYVAPVEGTAQGILAVDGSMAGIGIVDRPIILKVEKGLALEVYGGGAAIKLNGILHKYGDKARNIAELGIGIHPTAILTGAVLEDEKIQGTVHIALGGNSTIGGTVEVASHLDGIVLKPTLSIDGTLILKSGKFL